MNSHYYKRTYLMLVEVMLFTSIYVNGIPAEAAEYEFPLSAGSFANSYTATGTNYGERYTNYF